MTTPLNPNPMTGPDNKPNAESLSTICEKVLDDFLTEDRRGSLEAIPPSAVHDSILSEINRRIRAQNALEAARYDNSKGHQINNQPRLPFQATARLINFLHSVIAIEPSDQNADPDQNLLAVYDGNPASRTYGTYRTSQLHLETLVRTYCPDLTTKEFIEIQRDLITHAPRRQRRQHRDLIPVRNCIVDYNAGNPKRIEFSPEYVFLAKANVNWNPNAEKPLIEMPDGKIWDIEEWVKELAHDDNDQPKEGVAELIWEVIGATLRPFVSWNKCAFFFGTKGNNGKGTLLALMRNMIGTQGYASIPLSDFGKDFLLEPLTRANAVLVDENDVGSFVERSANFKAVVTNDIITINRKYKSPIAHQHFGFMVQCLNDAPAIKDKSESFYRRQLFIKFSKSFTGAERRYIKDDYLARPEVLEYVLNRVLHMNYYTLSEPQAVIDALEEYKQDNDPVRAFWNEVKNEYSWEILPKQFVYDHYRAWLLRNIPNSKPLGKKKVIDTIIELVRAEPNGRWRIDNPDAQHVVGARMAMPEMMIYEYDIIDWANRAANRNDPVAFSTTPLSRQDRHRGFVLNLPAETTEDEDAAVDDGDVDENETILDLSDDAAEVDVEPADQPDQAVPTDDDTGSVSSPAATSDAATPQADTCASVTTQGKNTTTSKKTARTPKKAPQRAADAAPGAVSAVAGEQPSDQSATTTNPDSNPPTAEVPAHDDDEGSTTS